MLCDARVWGSEVASGGVAHWLRTIRTARGTLPCPAVPRREGFKLPRTKQTGKTSRREVLFSVCCSSSWRAEMVMRAGDLRQRKTTKSSGSMSGLHGGRRIAAVEASSAGQARSLSALRNALVCGEMRLILSFIARVGCARVKHSQHTRAALIGASVRRRHCHGIVSLSLARARAR